MEADTPPVVMPATSAPRLSPWPVRATLVGGFLLAAGLLIPLGPFVLSVTGLLSAFQVEAAVVVWDLIANVLEGLGFLCGFLGIAATLRMPARGSAGTRRRDYLAVLLGGILLAAGILVAGAFVGYVFLVGPAAPFLLLDVGEIAGRLLQSIGFILVFAGIAWTLRARL